MIKNSLIKTNKYLRDPKTRANLIAAHAVGSSGIEGVKITKEGKRRLIKFYSVSDPYLSKALSLLK